MVYDTGLLNHSYTDWSCDSSQCSFDMECARQVELLCYAPDIAIHTGTENCMHVPDHSVIIIYLVALGTILAGL